MEHTNLIRKVINRNFRTSKHKDDLFQDGIIGLLKAKKKYDKKYGILFTTYAYHRIHGEMLDSIRKHGSLGFTGTRGNKQCRKENIKIEIEVVGLHEQDWPITKDDGFEKEYEDRQEVTKAISYLSERDKNIITMYYWDDLVQSEIAKIINRTESRVNQILSEIRKRLQRHILKERLQ